MSLKVAFESQEHFPITDNYDTPFSALGTMGNRNIVLSKQEYIGITYRATIRFYNSEGFTISQNGSPTYYPYIALYLVVNENAGEINSISTHIEGLNTTYGSNYTAFIEDASYDTIDFTKAVSEDTEKYDRKCFNSPSYTVFRHCIDIYMLSSDSTLTYISDQSRLSSLLGDTIAYIYRYN